MPDKQIDDGGPAFPGFVYNGAVMVDPESQKLIPIPARSDSGMSLRTWLAGQAMIGLILRRGPLEGAEDIAAAACEYADAMLIELGPETP